MLLRVALSDDGDDFIDVQVDRRDLADAVELTAEDSRGVTVAPFTLAGSMDRVLPALHTIVDRLRTIQYAPDDVTIELGLQIGGETGLIFAKGTAVATFAVTATWRSRPKGAPSAS